MRKSMLESQTILVTGPTSQVGLPVARELARRNRVLGLARFHHEDDAEKIRAHGIEPLALDLADGDLSVVPEDVDLVLHFAVVKSGDFDYDLRANAEGSARLLARCRRARAFLHVSSAAVYAYAGHEPVAESSPLGDNHRAMFPTYSLSKIAAESAVRFAAREFGVPTTIARLSVPYGDNGGWPWFHLMMMKAGQPVPVHPEQPNRYNPLHEDDVLETIPGLLDAADVPATTLNWGGSEPASIEDWCAWIGALTGIEPRFELTEEAFGSLQLDLGRMHAKLGRTRVAWRDGVRRMLAARNPELLLEDPA
jgi:nucleoside-diphosphate-sugar epimerase